MWKWSWPVIATYAVGTEEPQPRQAVSDSDLTRVLPVGSDS